jgi:hypothetical protein
LGVPKPALPCQKLPIEECSAWIGGHPANRGYRLNKPQGIAMRGSIIVGLVALAIAFSNAFEILASSLHAEPVWPTQRGANVTTSSESIPLFPKRLSGFISEAGQDFWGKPFPSRGTMRIFQGQSWQGIPDFPNTQNGCSSGAFMIRWRSANPDVRVQSSARYSSEISESIKTGAFGYMSGTNCEQPMFKFGGTINKNASTLVDIYYELKFWQAAP